MSCEVVVKRINGKFLLQIELKIKKQVENFNLAGLPKLGKTLLRKSSIPMRIFIKKFTIIF